MKRPPCHLGDVKGNTTSFPPPSLMGAVTEEFYRSFWDVDKFCEDCSYNSKITEVPSPENQPQGIFEPVSLESSQVPSTTHQKEECLLPPLCHIRSHFLGSQVRVLPSQRSPQPKPSETEVTKDRFLPRQSPTKLEVTSARFLSIQMPLSSQISFIQRPP